MSNQFNLPQVHSSPLLGLTVLSLKQYLYSRDSSTAPHKFFQKSFPQSYFSLNTAVTSKICDNDGALSFTLQTMEDIFFLCGKQHNSEGFRT